MPVIINKAALAERARNLGTLNGFDFVLVTLTPAVNPTAAQLEVHFQNNNSLAAIVADITGTPAHELVIFPISGGHRLPAGSMAGQVQVTGVAAGPGANVITLTVAPIGDYSTYTLGLQFANIDPMFSELEFKFRPGCFSTDCDPDWTPGKAPVPDPGIDYLSKDYDSFRHLLMTAMAQRVPGWRPTSEADLDQTLLDLFAAAGDELSDFQDRVMNEAYFTSARKRVSIARHARLMDYHIHQGNQASTYVALELAAAMNGVLPAGLNVWTGPKPAIPASQVYIAHQPQFVNTLLNRFGLYTWSDAIPALAAGATSADLRIDSGTALNANLVQGFFRSGQVTHLVIQEWLNPAIGPLLDANGVAAETTQCADPAIAVDQHQCLHAATLAILALGGRHHDARHDLAAPLDQFRQPRHRSRFHQPAVGEAQLQAVQVQFNAITRHGATASRAARPSL